jgi:hypothetical protein
MSYFDYCTGFTMTKITVETVWRTAMKPDQLRRHSMDVAASIQSVLDEAYCG